MSSQPPEASSRHARVTFVHRTESGDRERRFVVTARYQVSPFWGWVASVAEEWPNAGTKRRAPFDEPDESQSAFGTPFDGLAYGVGLTAQLFESEGTIG